MAGEEYPNQGNASMPSPTPGAATQDMLIRGAAESMGVSTSGLNMSYRQILDYLRQLALTGSLSQFFLGQPDAFDKLLADLGVNNNERRRINQSMTIQVRFGAQLYKPMEANDGLDEASIRGREGGVSEALARGEVTPGQVSGGTSFGAQEIWTAPWRKFSQDEFEQMQRMLYEGGFYSSDSPPVWTDRSDPGFRNAWFLAVQELYAAGNTNSMDEFLAQRAQTGGPEEEQLQLPEQIINLTDAAAIRTLSDDLAQGELGRKLNDKQKATMVELIHAYETSQQQAEIGVGTTNALTEAGINLGGVAGAINPDIVASTAGALAGQYGLTVGGQWRTAAQNFAIYGYERDSDHLRGMAVDISGSAEQMEALGAWAATQEGPGKLFRWVGWKDDANHFDHVHLSFNTQVTDPAATSSIVTGPSTNAGNALEQFMAATREVESGGDYGVTNSIGAYGAYQFMPGTWASAAAMAGINPSDKSPAAQDAAARALMGKYYQMYGDWQLVAVAWHGGEGLANKYKGNLQGLHGVSDGNISTYDYMQKVMNAMGNPTASGAPIGPGTTSIQGVDVAARLEEELRRKFPTEAKSHDLALQFQTFTDTAFGGLNSGGGEL